MSDLDREGLEAAAQAWLETLTSSKARASAEKIVRAYLSASRSPRDLEAAEGNHCPACGEYMPLTLDGANRVHGCDRTPPLDGLPPTIYACPTCGGHGASRWGCWGTQERPHPHAYMQLIHELLVSGPVLPEGLSEEEAKALHTVVLNGWTTDFWEEWPELVAAREWLEDHLKSVSSGGDVGG